MCNGNIFGVTNIQICCQLNQIYNQSTQTCSTCSGVVDSTGTLCCPQGSFVAYNTNGTTICSPECPLELVQNSIYCCSICSASCQTPLLSCATPKSCSYSYFVPNSCNPCSCGSCTADPNCIQCDANLQLSSPCNPFCPINKIYDSTLSSCLDCDESCDGCSEALTGTSCISCAEGFYKTGGNCEKCYFKCKTCQNSSSTCTSCFNDSLNSELVSNNCVPYCY